MALSKAAKRTTAAAVRGGAGGAAQTPFENVPWPRLKPKTLPAPEWLIPDQVCLFPNFLSTDECNAIIRLFSSAETSSEPSIKTSAKNGKTSKSNGPAADGGSSTPTLALSPSPPAKKGEAVRTNHRASTIDRDFASQLYSIGIDRAVADWPSLQTKKAGVERRPAGLHSNIRIYRYDPQALFGPHYDQSSQCPTTGLLSEWTLLIYLSGPESGLTGGQTIFYDKHTTASSTKTWEVEPRTGLALLHRHGYPACTGTSHQATKPLNQPEASAPQRFEI
ncbi:unnamed protein product [Tilletia caries]|nr:unnamed protein product [Tilletia caries]